VLQTTVLQIILLVSGVLAGIAAGWLLRGIRAGKERNAINATWREKASAQEQELQRLLEQNSYLMDQNQRFRSDSTAAKKRARELAEAVQEANLRRKELRRKIKGIRGDLENVVAQRNELKQTMAAKGDSPRAAKDKDRKIFKLSRELESWQSRLPPLIERYRERSDEAQRLKKELASANERIEALEESLDGSVSVVEPVQHPDVLTDGRDASNDTIDTERPTIRAESGGNSLRDNLQLIRGIGPAIEKTLNEMGIFRYQQIAGMSEYDIDRIAQRLKGFHSRIYREDWIGQARELDTRNISA
jgi:predicted flap endonuclease-1-like 5' DNA nuclease